jgi:hypothetical protein
MNNKQLLAAAKALISAWESLPGGREYSPKQISNWLSDNMKPAVYGLRNAIRAVKAAEKADSKLSKGDPETHIGM